MAQISLNDFIPLNDRYWRNEKKIYDWILYIEG